MYGLILWGLGYSFISQHCVKFWSYKATKQKWYGERKGCHGKMLFKLMPGKTTEKHEISIGITSNPWPVFKLGHHQIQCKDVKPYRFKQSEVLCCVSWNVTDIVKEWVQEGCLNIKALPAFETSKNIYQVTQYNISGDLNAHQHNNSCSC